MHSDYVCQWKAFPLLHFKGLCTLDMNKIISVMFPHVERQKYKNFLSKKDTKKRKMYKLLTFPSSCAGNHVTYTTKKQ